MSVPGALYGVRMNHPAALASTVHEPCAMVDHGTAMRQVASYARAAGEAAFRVVHDGSVNRPYGRFAVYIGEQRVGAQLSFPSVEDCRRMESPPALSAPYEERLSLATRQALGVLTPSEKARRSAQQAAYYAKKKAQSIRRGAAQGNTARARNLAAKKAA